MHRPLAVILAICVAVKMCHGHVAAEESRPSRDGVTTKLLVPAYFYPAAEGLATWNQLIESQNPAKQIDIVVIANINSGNVGTTLDPNYADVIERAAKKGMKVIAYITSDYANQNGIASLELAKTNVTNWFKLYPQLQGVFVDEQTSDSAAIDTYYLPLRRHIDSVKPDAFVVGNPGNNCMEDYLVKRDGGPIMDVVIIHENNETKRPYSSVRPSTWMAMYSSDRFAMLVHTSRTFIPQLELAKANRTSYVFVTDIVGPPPATIHPWGKLPTYWADELNFVGKLNGHTAK